MNIVLIIYVSIRKFWINGHKSNMPEINEESNSNSILNQFSQCCSFREFSLTQECILKHPGTVQIELIVGIINVGGGHGNSLPYSCLENPMDRGIWRATIWVGWRISVRRVSQSQARLKWQQSLTHDKVPYVYFSLGNQQSPH